MGRGGLGPDGNPGRVALSAREYPNYHILGHGFRNGDTKLARLCEKFRVGRGERKYKIVDFLREKGVDIDLTEAEDIAGARSSPGPTLPKSWCAGGTCPPTGRPSTAIWTRRSSGGG